MLRKDFFQAEIEKLSQVLARIIGLKNEDKPEESKRVLQETLVKDFGLNLSEVAGIPEEDFQELLKVKDFPVQKLDILAQLLFEASRIFEDLPQTMSVLNKVLLIFNSLEKEHHTQSLENLNKRSMIEKFIKANNT